MVDNKKLQMPYGDSGLFDVMGLWGPEGCRYPYFGFMPDEPLCNECSSMAQAKETCSMACGTDRAMMMIRRGTTTGCTAAELPRLRLRLRGLPSPATSRRSARRRSCIHVAQQYAPANSVCAGSDVKWDTTVSGCTDEYGTGTQFDSTWSGDACLDSTGATTVVQDASATCYQTQASISEADLVDYKANPKQCAVKPISAAARAGPAISAVLALVGAVALGP